MLHLPILLIPQSLVGISKRKCVTSENIKRNYEHFLGKKMQENSIMEKEKSYHFSHPVECSLY
jgi:hypothetical protein